MSGLSGYFRDRPIWVKLGLIVLVPTIATVFVGFSALLGNINSANNADRARNLAALTGNAGDLVHDLQDERAAATLLLTASAAEQQSALAKYQGLFVKTTQASNTYTQRRNSLTGLPAGFRDQLKGIDTSLGALDNLHQQVAKLSEITLDDTVQRYSALISSLVLLRDAASQLAGDAGLSFDMRAGAAIANVKEQLSEERVTVLRILRRHELTSDAQVAFLTARAGQDLALRPFYTVATQSQQDLLAKIVTGPNVSDGRQYEDYLSKLLPGPLPPDAFDIDQWEQAMVGRSNLMRQVETSLDTQTLSEATSLHSRVQRQVLLGAGLLIVLVLIVLMIAWAVARSMNRALRELRQGAMSIAQYGLPQAVARLRDPSLSGQMSPQQMAQQIADPLPVRSRDEFGQVTEAFNAVHLEAVRTAAEQAALRSSVSTMFVNLARRSQILVDRLIGHLDRLERGEEDPDRLAELFQLDHLATRMRRNDENLLVLAGADSTRVQREPAALIDVLRAAQSEVEHYTRIEFGVIDRDIEVGAHAVNDLVHLVAELFDNATAFSPPDSSVIVEARRVGDRAVLYVEDHGIGMSPDQLADLNERLATPPMVDVAVSRMMGLVVVARLADRHGVKVELRPAPDRGTVADVLLPTTALIPRALAGRGPSAGVPLTREPTPAPAPRQGGPVPPRSPFATPLALESGPAGGLLGPGPGMAGSGAPTGPSTGGFGGFGGPPSGLGAFGGGGIPGSPVSGAPSGGRQLPAWSDLTGAVNGTNGVDPFAAGHNGPSGRGTPPGPTAYDRGLGPDRQGLGPDRQGLGPDRQGPGTLGPDRFAQNDTSGFAGSPLPQRRATEPPTVEGEVTGDLRGLIPRQVPSSPEARPTEPGPRAVEPDDAVDADVVEDDRIFVAPTAPTPPAWPPVPSAQVAAEDDQGAPPVPEDLASALDITSEMPRLQVDEEPSAGGAQAAGWNTQSGASRLVPEAYSTPVVPAAYAPPPLFAPQPTAGPATPPPLSAPPVPAQAPSPQPLRPAEAEPARASYPDETMELPIFRELESAWFRSRGTQVSAPAPSGYTPAPSGPEVDWSSDGDLSVAGTATAPQPAAAAEPGPALSWPSPAAPAAGNMAAPAPAGATDNGQVGSSYMPGGRMPVPEPVWLSAADEGWRAATAAAEPEVVGVTDAGLPKRVPMAQLVPGGVEKSTVNANRRSPEQVRGLLSAYHRGVQRGRGRGDDDRGPESSTATGHSPQGGKEQDA